jgi:hypothetical protein
MNELAASSKVACKQEFMARFGRPEQLRESQVLDALALVDRWETVDVEAAQVEAGEAGDGDVPGVGLDAEPLPPRNEAVSA